MPAHHLAAALIVAAQLGITPRVATIDAHHPIAQVSVSSLRARTVIFDTRLERWEQRGDNDTYAATDSFVAVPSVFSLDPYATRTVRVALRAPATDDREGAYRLSIVEVIAGAATPPPSARAFSIPLFVAPAKVSGEVRYELRAHAGNTYDVVVHNESNTHTYIGTLAVESADQELYAGKAATFVLAGNTRAIPVKLRAPVHGSVTLRIAGEDGSERSIPVQAIP
ncbi:MAG TPA: fimbria/pilus periplasmic chaperone [Candidatus Rubrimentiphilum sp.]|nr:fimbria/pilus periplasmic chaperone [Candidatus Rubrimentiphilum sp.]